jgi:PAS domain S-box-containing protein
MRAKDGQWLWVWAVGTCIEWDEEHKPRRFIGTHRDVTGRKLLEGSVVAERDRAQKYLDITPALVVSLDTDGIVRLMNQKGCEILEGKVEEIVGKDWFDNFVPEDIRSEVKRVFARLMAGEAEAVEYYENTVLTLRGTQKIVAWHNTILYDDEGETIGILSSGEDITERRAAQNMLRESEHRFKTMFDTAISGIILADLETKRFVLCNDTICNMLGYSHEEFPAMGVADIHPEDSLPFVFEQFDKQVRGEIKIVRDLPVKRKDGSVFYADVSAAPVTLSGIKYLMGYFSDSTERMLAESALIESEERYRSIFEESNEVIFISTPEGRLEDINPTGVALFGYPSRDAMIEIDIGKELFVDAEARIQYQERIERSGAVQHYEMKLRKKDGEEVIVSVSARAVEDDGGNVINYRGVMRDITEQRRLENQLIQSQKMESIGNLAGGVAHDFNNYLTAIQGYADLALLELPEDSVLQDYLSEIRSSSVRAADLTRQLLLFGRREDIVLKPVELAETISSIQKMLGRLIGERYTIVTRIPGNLALIMADKGLVEQVIVNLVVNSRDAMPEGGEVTIDAANVELEKEPLIRASGLPGGDYIHIKVSDNGHGIDSEPLKRIFEPFYTTKDVGKGTGLGLSVVYGIITQHNGMIDVESEVGRGTTFNIYIPAAQDAHEAGEITPTGRGGVMGSGMRLLLVEDDEAVRNLASRMLVENGFIVSTAASAGEAEKIFNENQGEYDIVFSDVILPDDNGVFLVERLREKKPDMSIVLASGYTGEELDRGQIEEKGFTFLQKPYTLTELLGIIGELAKK